MGALETSVLGRSPALLGGRWVGGLGRRGGLGLQNDVLDEVAVIVQGDNLRYPVGHHPDGVSWHGVLHLIGEQQELFILHLLPNDIGLCFSACDEASDRRLDSARVIELRHKPAGLSLDVFSSLSGNLRIIKPVKLPHLCDDRPRKTALRPLGLAFPVAEFAADSLGTVLRAV